MMKRKIKRRKKYPYMENFPLSIYSKKMVYNKKEMQGESFRLHLNKSEFIDLDITTERSLHVRLSGLKLGLFKVIPRSSNSLILELAGFMDEPRPPD